MQVQKRLDMAESGVFSGKSGTDLTALKEALNAQQQLLHKLYAELDQEREASETAASEALSMILRLQGEKAAVEMEAKQYKRMAEEKMFHADECVAIFEDVIYQKDMEIAALESQIQAYKYKLLSLGCNDIDCIEAENSESAFLQKIESFYGGGEGNSMVDDLKRNIALPPVYPMALPEREKFQANSNAWNKNEDPADETKNIGVDQELKVGSVEPPDIDTYWQQIKKLDEKVKGISHVKEFGRRNRRNSLGPLVSQGSLTALNSCLEAVKKNPEIKPLQPSRTIDVTLSSYKVQDIFEVSEVVPSRNVDGKKKIESEEKITGCESRLEKPDSPTMVKSLFKSELKTGFALSPENKLFKSSGRRNLDHYNLACAHSAITNAESRTEIEQLSKRIERIELATTDANIRTEITPIQGEEFGSLKELLNEIQKQLSTIQSDIRLLTIDKSKKLNGSTLGTIQKVHKHL